MQKGIEVPSAGIFNTAPLQRPQTPDNTVTAKVFGIGSSLHHSISFKPKPVAAVLLTNPPVRTSSATASEKAPETQLKSSPLQRFVSRVNERKREILERKPQRAPSPSTQLHGPQRFPSNSAEQPPLTRAISRPNAANNREAYPVTESHVEFDVSAYLRQMQFSTTSSSFGGNSEHGAESDRKRIVISRSKLISPIPGSASRVSSAASVPSSSAIHAGRTAAEEYSPPPVATAVSSSTTPQTPHAWIDTQRPLLQAVAVPMSPPDRATISGLPRTLADRAIRLGGFRSASSLARAFELTPSSTEIARIASVRIPDRLL